MVLRRQNIGSIVHHTFPMSTFSANITQELAAAEYPISLHLDYLINWFVSIKMD